MPGNPARGLDAHQGLVTLFDGDTGVPTAILDAAAITEIRTAAVTAVATGVLARRGAQTLAILGAGTQARAHLRALAGVREFDQVRVYAPTEAHARAAVEQAAAGPARRRSWPSPRTAAEAVRGADVVVTATSAREPVLRRDWLKPGRARQRGRRQHPAGARDRHRDRGRQRAVLRQPRVAPQRGRRVPARGQRGPDRRRGARPRRAR